MGQKASPWTDAIESLLSDGQWHDTEAVLAAGAAAVPEDRALHEMRDKKSDKTSERRIQIGQRNVAVQSVTGLVRFGKAEYGEGKRKIRKIGDKSRSLGELGARVDELSEQLARALDQIESMQAQLDRLDAASEGQDPGEQFLASVGVSSTEN